MFVLSMSTAITLGLIILVMMLICAATISLLAVERHRVRLMKEGLMYARGAAQDFCQLSGDSQRMLERVSVMWTADPKLLETALSTLTPGQQAGLKAARQEGLVQMQKAKIAEMTAHYSEFVGQTPLPSEVGIRGARKRP